MSIRDDSNQEWHFDEYKKTAIIERPLPSIYTNNENIPVATLIEQADLNVIYDHLDNNAPKHSVYSSSFNICHYWRPNLA